MGLRKLVTYVPLAHADQVRLALFNAGAGHIGRYDSCSFNTEGKGSFQCSGRISILLSVKLVSFILKKKYALKPYFRLQYKSQVIEALLKAHPYEEVAYDIYPVENTYELVGSGMIGELDEP